jgi:CDP-diacylglycerol--glycerol-3-phosphate 3-phosphatidyltransferase
MNDTKSKITDPDRILTLSNFISLLRVLLVFPAIYYLNKPESNLILITLIVIIILSDMLDGYIARRAHEVTHVGMWLDPLADSIVIVSITFYLSILGQFPMWFFIFFITRYATIALPGLYLINHKHFVNSANIPGKMATGLVAITIILHIFPIPSHEYLNKVFIGLAFTLLMISWIMYMKRYYLEFKKV